MERKVLKENVVSGELVVKKGNAERVVQVDSLGLQV